MNEEGDPKYVVDNDKKFLVSNKNYQLQKANQLRQKAKTLADKLRSKIPDVNEKSSTSEDVSESASV
jgi:hypothetical protein